MLYALHLHAASVVDSDGALTHFRVGDAALHFASDTARQLLFILSTPAVAGEEAPAHLAAQLLERFAACHPGGMVVTPRASLRQSFAPGLREALRSFPGWLLQQLVERAAAAAALLHNAAADKSSRDQAPPQAPFGSPLPAAAVAASVVAATRALSAAVLLAPELCELLMAPQHFAPADAPVAGRVAQRGGGRGGRRRGERTKGRWGLAGSGGGVARRSGDEELYGSHLWAAATASVSGGDWRAAEAASVDRLPPTRCGWLGCCGGSGARRGSARRPAPHPKGSGSETSAEPPPLYWYAPDASGSEGRSQVPPALALQELLREAYLAWRGGSYLPELQALCMAASAEPHSPLPPPSPADGSAAQVGGGATAYTVFLLRPPLLLRLRASSPTGVGGADAAVAVAAMLAHAAHPWLPPLELTLGFIASRSARAPRADAAAAVGGGGGTAGGVPAAAATGRASRIDS